jgi:hypothetical protein
VSLRKKLYYDFFFQATHDVVVPGFILVIPFVAGTGADFASGAQPDRYGNLIEPSLLDGVPAAADPSGLRRTSQAVTGVFQVSSATLFQAGTAPPIPLDGQINGPSLDFIAETGPDSGPQIDPTTVRRPRARLRISAAGSGIAIRGVLHLQRQNSLEV